ncbi:MAG: periplasmic protein TonB [Acidobacteriota bacterium]|jgi:TonB family protein|nr:periplasmic protein TonB [Acidobacteriota bacterium]
MAPAWEDKAMFGNLVESSSHKGDYARRGSFFLGTLSIYALAFLAIGVGSIYAYNTRVENQDLRVVSMVAPAEPSEAQPQQRTSVLKSSGGGSNNSRVAVFKTPPVIAIEDPRLIQQGMSVAKSGPELPPNTLYKIGVPGSGNNIFGSVDKTGGDGSGGNGSNKMDELVKETPPPAMKVETSKPPAVKPIKSLGVVNGMATYLPKPAYSAIAKAAHASGMVTVQVLIDENGRVISAHALNGHPLLLQPSVQAALQARFTPTMLSNQPVKVSGVITYNFVMQ